MTKISLKDISALLLRSVNGSVSVGINSNHFLDVVINQGYVKVDVLDRRLSRSVASKVPRQLMKLSLLRSYSKFFNRQGICLEVTGENGTLIKIGKGVSPLLDHIDVHPLRLHEFMK